MVETNLLKLDIFIIGLIKYTNINKKKKHQSSFCLGNNLLKFR